MCIQNVRSRGSFFSIMYFIKLHDKKTAVYLIRLYYQILKEKLQSVVKIPNTETCGWKKWHATSPAEH